MKNPKAYAAKVLDSVRQEHLEAALALEASDPSLTAEQLADQLEPPERTTVPASESRHPSHVADRRRARAAGTAEGDFEGFRQAFRATGLQELTHDTVRRLAREHGCSFEDLCDLRIIGDFNTMWRLRGPDGELL